MKFRVSDIVNMECGELHGAENCAELIFAAGAAEFSNDYSPNSPILNRYVCQHHIESLTWKFLWKETGKIKLSNTCSKKCMITDKDIKPEHKNLAKVKRGLTVRESWAILLEFGVFYPAQTRKFTKVRLKK